MRACDVYCLDDLSIWTFERSLGARFGWRDELLRFCRLACTRENLAKSVVFLVFCCDEDVLLDLLATRFTAIVC